MPVSLSIVMPVYNERYLVGEAIRRVLAVRSEWISELQLVVVDDGSSDGTRAILAELARQHADRMLYIEHETNLGKGAAVRTGIEHCTGDVTLIHDADLEYDPQDIPRLMLPFVRQGADAVYGSRFSDAEYRRVLYFRHTLGNRLITLLANLGTDLNLSDVETGYKAVRTPLLKSIPIRSEDFRIENELTLKLAKRNARIFEVPISYNGRSYEEGKKIGLKDAPLALAAILRWWLIDDLYRPDQYGSNILAALSEVPRFNRWMADQLRPFVGSRVLEIGAGIGNLTRTMLPRDSYIASEINPLYLEQLRVLAESRPYMSVVEVDLACSDHFSSFRQQVDTVICLNVLEHVPEEGKALANLFGALAEDGRALILVPQHPWLYGSLDEVLEHCRRYTRRSLEEALLAAGFAIDLIFDFNRISVPGWWLNARLLRRRHIGRVQLKILDSFLWLLKRIDPWLPWGGVSLIAVARRPAAESAK